MKGYRLNRIVIKPTLLCNANCRGCISRRDLHKSMRSDVQPSIEQWKTILHEASTLGLKNLHISGGEPTLYKNLVVLIESGKKLGLHVRMNTNGSTITKESAEQMLEAGLDEICISLYSHQPKIHNLFCKSDNLWQKAVRAIQIFSDLRSGYPDFFLGTMSIILKENYRSLDKVVKFHHQLGSQQIGLSYLEGDFLKKYLLNKGEILEFRSIIVPKLLKYAQGLDYRIRKRAINMIQGLYGSSAGYIDDLSRGIYWKKKYCNIPKTAGLIMANGDVHPCNIVEYTHEPIMGNLLESSLRRIWHSEKWNKYRINLNQKCEACPVNVYVPLPLMFTSETSRWETLYHSKIFDPFRSTVKNLLMMYEGRKQRIRH